MSQNCLNCTAPVMGNYCHTCGQKSTTHRYSIIHFIEHDFIHGVWHVDKGILFTIKELFNRPGHGVREFILGKRANYFSFVTLILIILTLTTLISPYMQVKITDLMPDNGKDIMNSLEKFVSNHPKLLLLALIPLNSVFSFIWFRKAKLNYSEHLVANSYKAAAELIIGFLFSILTIFYTNLPVLSILYLFVIGPIIVIYDMCYYVQLFSVFGYRRWVLVLRSLGTILSIAIFQGIIIALWGILEKLKH